MERQRVRFIRKCVIPPRDQEGRVLPEWRMTPDLALPPGPWSGLYNANEEAGFVPEQAAALVAAGFAVVPESA